MAMNHGSTSSTSQSNADSGLSASSQRAERSKRERARREHDEHQDQRPLQQHAGGERGPENRRQGPGRRSAGLAELAQIDARHRAHGGDAVSSSMASVLASRASTPSMIEPAIIRPASSAARRDTKASAAQ